MAMVNVPSIFWPDICQHMAYGNGSNGAIATLDVAGDYYAVIVRAKEDMTISHVWFDANAVTGSPTAELRIETVDATTGFPTGTLWATNTTTGTTPTLTTTGTAFALIAPATITKSQVFAIKVLYISGTSFTVGSVTQQIYRQNSNYFVDNSTGTPAKANPSSVLRLGLGNSATTYYSIDCMIPTNGKASNGIASTQAEGARFQIPFKARCCGFAWHNISSTGDFNAVLWDDAGNELSSSSTLIDGDQNCSSVAAGISTAMFDSPVLLSPSTNYRIGIEPTSATTVNFNSWDFSAGISGGVSFPNQRFVTRTAGVWNDDAGGIAALCLIIDQLDDGA